MQNGQLAIPVGVTSKALLKFKVIVWFNPPTPIVKAPGMATELANSYPAHAGLPLPLTK